DKRPPLRADRQETPSSLPLTSDPLCGLSAYALLTILLGAHAALGHADATARVAALFAFAADIGAAGDARRLGIRAAAVGIVRGIGVRAVVVGIVRGIGRRSSFRRRRFSMGLSATHEDREREA